MLGDQALVGRADGMSYRVREVDISDDWPNLKDW